MRLIPLALFAGLALTTMAQDPPFERHFTIPGALEIYGATRDDLGNYYIANETVDEDIQVTCLSASGEHQWTRAYPVKLALSMNPKCPPQTAVKFLNYLTDRDLGLIMRSRDVAGVISAQARRILARKGKT